MCDRNMFRHTSLILIISCWWTSGFLFGGKKHTGDIIPAENYLVYGEVAQFNCTLREQVIDISQLQFQIGNTNISSNQTSVLNDETLQCTIPVIQEYFRPGYNTILCWNTTIDRTKYNLITASYLVDYAVIHNVTDLACFIHKTSRSIQCSWTLGKYYFKPLIKVKFSVSINGNGWVTKNVTTDTTQSCTFDEGDNISIHPLYISFKLEITNTKRNITEKFIKVIDPADRIVKPEMVQNVETKEITSRSSQIVWSLPSVYPFSVRLNVSSKWSQDQLINEVDNTDKVVLMDLKPYTRYSVSVEVRLAEGVLYSDPIYTEFTTEPDLPDVPPLVHPVGFNLGSGICHSHSGIDTRNITVYWKPIPEEHTNGQIVNYAVTYASNTGREDTVIVNGDRIFTTLTLKCDQSYDINVKAKNSVGFSNVSATMKVPSDGDCHPLDDIVVEVPEDEGNVTISWEGENSDNNYIVAWCQKIADNSGCIDGIMFSSEYAPGTSKVTIARSDIGEDIHTQRFGVAPKTLQQTSGITWEKCRYQQNTGPPAPKNFKIASINPNNALTGEWSLPECDWQSGYVQRYRIKYCMVKNGDLHNCKDTEFERDDRMEYVVRDLNVNQNYSLQLQTISPASMESPYVDPVYGVPTTDELQKGVLIVIIIGSAFGFIVVVSCVVCGAKHTYRKVKSVTRPLEINLPHVNTDRPQVMMTSRKQIYEVGPPSPALQLPGTDGSNDRRNSDAESLTRLISRQESRDSGTGSLEIPMSPMELLSLDKLLNSVEERPDKKTTEPQNNQTVGEEKDHGKKVMDHGKEEKNLGKEEQDYGKEETNLGKEEKDPRKEIPNGYSRATLVTDFIPQQSPDIMVFNVAREQCKGYTTDEDGRNELSTDVFENPLMLHKDFASESDYGKESQKSKEAEFTNLSNVDNDMSVQSIDLFGSGLPNMEGHCVTNVEESKDPETATPAGGENDDSSSGRLEVANVSSGKELCDTMFIDRDSESELSNSNHVSVPYVTYSAINRRS